MGGASQVTLLLELLVQDVSVLVEAAVDASNLPVFTHPQLLTHQPDQTLVVGHQDDPALKRMTSHAEEIHLGRTCQVHCSNVFTLTLNLLRALARASMVSMSRWLVGSSRM